MRDAPNEQAAKQITAKKDLFAGRRHENRRKPHQRQPGLGGRAGVGHDLKVETIARPVPTAVASVSATMMTDADDPDRH